jgi:hypothetical protein
MQHDAIIGIPYTTNIAAAACYRCGIHFHKNLMEKSRKILTPETSAQRALVEGHYKKVPV